MNNELILWIVFGVLVVAILSLDLGVLNRKAHVIKLKEAVIWSIALVVIALLFGLLIYLLLGESRAMSYLTAYLVEQSLSIDNLFVFMVVFTYFKVPETSRHRVLFWGIIGAMIFRAIFIVAGITAVERIHWIVYIFGAFLLYTGIRLTIDNEREVHPDRNIFVRLVRRMVPVTSEYHENKFFTRENSRRVITPLLLVLVVVETTDVLICGGLYTGSLIHNHRPAGSLCLEHTGGAGLTSLLLRFGRVHPAAALPVLRTGGYINLPGHKNGCRRFHRRPDRYSFGNNIRNIADYGLRITYPTEEKRLRKRIQVTKIFVSAGYYGLVKPRANSSLKASNHFVFTSSDHDGSRVGKLIKQ